MLIAELFSRANAVVAEVQELGKHLAVPTTAEHFTYRSICNICTHTCRINNNKNFYRSMRVSLQGGASHSPALSMAAPMIAAAAAETNTLRSATMLPRHTLH